MLFRVRHSACGRWTLREEDGWHTRADVQGWGGSVGLFGWTIALPLIKRAIISPPVSVYGQTEWTFGTI